MSRSVSWVRPFILSVTLLVLGGFAYWLEFKHKPEVETAEENEKKIFSLKTSPIDTISISNGTQHYELHCEDAAAKLCKAGDNSKWKLVQPLQTKADDSNANSFVSALNNLQSAESIDLSTETPEKRASLLKEYGLSPEQRNAPEAKKIVVKTTAGTTTLFVGATHPITNNYFAISQTDSKLNDSKILMLAQYFKSNLEHDLNYWRDKKILAVAVSDISSFKIEKKGEPAVHAERKDGNWLLNGEFAGDKENIETMLNSLAFLNATKFVSNEKNDKTAKDALKGAKEYLTFTYVAKDKPTTITLFEKPVPGEKEERKWLLFATVSTSDPLYEVQNGTRNQLGKKVQDLRLSKLLTAMERFGAKRLEFSGKPIGDKPLILVAQNDKWVTDPDKVVVSNIKVQNTLDRLSGNRIREFYEGAKIPAGEKDGLKIVLSDEKGAKKREFVFWKSGNNLFARDLASKRNEAFLVDPAITGGLPWNRDFFNVSQGKK